MKLSKILLNKKKEVCTMSRKDDQKKTPIYFKTFKKVG